MSHELEAGELRLEQVPVCEDGEHFTDMQFRIHRGGETLGEVGVQLYSTVDMLYYTWFEPSPTLDAKYMRSFRELIHKLFKGSHVFATIPAKDKRELKFAKFIGFEPVDKQAGFVHLQRAF